MAVVVEGGLVLMALVLAWLFDINLRDQLPADGTQLWGAIARGIVATMPMLVMFWVLVRSQRPEWRKLREQVEWLLGELFPTSSIAQFALVALLAGVGEELLFRGVAQRLLVDWTSLPIGLLAGSLLFGFAHALSRLYFVLATLIGLYLGVLTVYYNDLGAPITAHALYDFLALVYLSRHRQAT
jgi:membrane protease YdiL (CAAX protease family)